MGLYDVLDQIIALLRQRKRLTYRLLKREFALDDETLADLKDELIYAQQLAVEEDERVLVWIGDTEPMVLVSYKLNKLIVLYGLIVMAMHFLQTG